MQIFLGGCSLKGPSFRHERPGPKIGVDLTHFVELWIKSGDL